MTPPHPPRVPTWLLERWGRGSPHAASLVGDLAEEYAQGRSSAWYWKQAITAIALHLLQTLRAHALSFILAVIAGCALYATWPLLDSLAFAPAFKGAWRASEHDPWPQAWPLFAVYLLLRASYFCSVFVSGWAVTRVHQAHQRAVLVALVLALTIQRVPWAVRLAFDTSGNTRFASYLVDEIYSLLFQAAFVLTAGLWIIQARRFADMGRRTRSLALLVAFQLLLGAVIFAAIRTGAMLPPRAAILAWETVHLASVACLALILWPPSAAAVR